MEVAAGRGGAIPVPSPQAARKEWRAIPEHSFRSNGGEEQEHVKLAQSAERTIHEVQVGPVSQDVDFCSLTIDDGGELNDNVLQQKLQEITRQREELQKMEIHLEARRIARSEVLELQDSFEVQLKEQIDINGSLKEKVHEMEKHILELERKLEDKDRELRAMKIDTEAAWAKEDLLREQNKELATFRRERDNSEAERAQHLSQIRDLQEHIQEKESQFLALQEQHRVAQETILFKDEQLREAQSWIARVQEMDALQSSTNQSLQAELRERTEQFNQYWLGFQRQFVEMERHHLQAIQQLQLELAEAREKNGIYKDGSRVNHETSMDSSSYKENQISMKDDGKSNGHLGFTSNGSVDGPSSNVSASNSSSKTDNAPGVTVVPSSIIGMNGFIPPGQMAPLNSYVMNPLSVQHALPSTNSPIPLSLMDHYQSMTAIPNQQQWQNSQVVPDVLQLPNQSKHSSPQTEQDLLGSDAQYSFNLPGEIQIGHPEHLNNHRDQQQISGNPANDLREETQLPVTQQPQGALDAPTLDSARDYDQTEEKNGTKAENVSSQNQSQEHVFKSRQQWPTSSTMLSTSQISASANGTTESSVFAAAVSCTLISGKPTMEPNLLDERSLLSCIVRAIPAGSDGRIRISTTLPNRLGKMLAPLHWHDYKKHYGRLDDFVARHPELFVIEGDFIHLREGAQQIISATAAFAKVAAAAAVPALYSSLLPSVAVTPVAQANRQKKIQSIESKAVNSMPFTDGAALTIAGDSSDKPTQILTRQNEQQNGVRFNIVQGLSDVTISNKLKNVQEANCLPSEIKPGHSSVYFAVGNAANPDRVSLSPSQNKGMSNGRPSFGGKQQGRTSGIGLIAKK
ncbi:hypothetical protein Cni_G13964 [Canna indica]|uniref:DUF7725 domain-containing protein n=1 Tax=Canna indica TaxID=4628 RepID=A0AAQ3KFJ1_9LILI|nr:hypothetical protein Cni_G13964 [Canna indica]